MKKYSILGMALIAVSAITAAFAPSKSSADGKQLAPGTIKDSTVGGDPTCTVGNGDACDYTITVGKENGVSNTGANTLVSTNPDATYTASATTFLS